ncbi:MAG: hypothetical protein ACJ75S_08550 [Solirubrobacterales bacterium]
MEGRTIPLHGGGELVIGGGPLIEGLIHGWVRKPTPAPDGNFMISVKQARELAEMLRTRGVGKVGLFAGTVMACQGADLTILWFYGWGSRTPEFAARLNGGAAGRFIDALSDHYESADAEITRAA